MKNLLARHRLTAILLGIFLMPITYADSDVNDVVSIEQVRAIYPIVPRITSSAITNNFNNSDEVLVTQLGDNNHATVDVNGDNNQLRFTQTGNRNNGDIQVNGDGNKLSALQNGDGLNFGLKIEGDSRAYILTQEKH